MTVHQELQGFTVGAGLITGMTTTTIEPQGTASRAQVAAMVKRLADFIK